jgi:predicted permease
MHRFILKLIRRRRLERDLDAELAFHRDMAARHGNPVGLGNAAAIKEQAGDLWRFNFIENLWRDIVHGARALRRSPALAAGAVLSLSLGAGANIAIFSLGFEFLLSDPSVERPEAVVTLAAGGRSHAAPSTIEFMRESGVFAGVAGFNEMASVNWNDGTETRRIFAFTTTKNYFTLLGIPAAHGRGYADGDPDEVVVLHHRFWRRHFHSDPAVIDRSINLEGRAYTIAGILPRNHRTLAGLGLAPGVYIPAAGPPEDTMLAMCARLKPGMTFGQDFAAYRTAAGRLDAAAPSPYWARNSHQMDAVGGLTRLRHEKMLPLGLFFAALLTLSGLVLLIACINLAGILLARASARRRELAIRLALGAGRARLMQQLLVESLMLSVAGAALGFVFAQGVAALAASLQLPLPVPVRLQAEPDWRAVSYALLLAAFSALVCGLLPAWQPVRESIASRLDRENRFRLRRALVGCQIAVSVIVLATGALFLRNLVRSNDLSPGFDVRRTVRADVHLPRERYRDPASIALFVERSTAALRALPGVEAAAGARLLPFTGAVVRGGQISFPGGGEAQRVEFAWNAVTPDYFRAMGIPVRGGREFTAADRGQTKVVAVNGTFVDRYLGGRAPLGTAFMWGRDERTPYRIVAVAGGTKTLAIGEEQKAQVYEPLAQIANDRIRVQFVVRSAVPPETQLNAVQRALRGIEPNAGVEAATLYSSIGLAFLPSQAGAALLGSIGALGLLLAGVGIYGTMLYTVARRTREIGVRMAVGATRADIARLVLSESLRLLAIGSAAGVCVAYFATQPLAMFLVPGLKPSDPVSFVAALAVLGLGGLIASWDPTRRAVNIDPMHSLRHE